MIPNLQLCRDLIREISPGKLLYMHDSRTPSAQVRINSLSVEVKR